MYRFRCVSVGARTQKEAPHAACRTSRWVTASDRTTREVRRDARYRPCSQRRRHAVRDAKQCSGDLRECLSNRLFLALSLIGVGWRVFSLLTRLYGRVTLSENVLNHLMLCVCAQRMAMELACDRWKILCDSFRPNYIPLDFNASA